MVDTGGIDFVEESRGGGGVFGDDAFAVSAAVLVYVLYCFVECVYDLDAHVVREPLSPVVAVVYGDFALHRCKDLWQLGLYVFVYEETV